MAEIGIFYGSSTGNTEKVAKRIGVIMGIANSDIYDVANTKPSTVDKYNVLILGTSTWGSGDLQDDWDDFIKGLEELDLVGKKIAIFGCGDETMSDTFCSAIGVLYEKLQKTGANFIGSFEASEYTFDESAAFIDGKYVGLLLDEVNHSGITEKRVEQWCKLIKKEIDE